MGGDVLGGGVVWALAAALWVLYFIPTWLRRRRFNATERNAVRLQQTLRILAETAEIPEHVRLEATAREVAVQQRKLRVTETHRRAEEKAQAMELARAEKAAREALSRAAADVRRSTRSKRGVMRVRRSAALAVVLGLVAAVVGLVMTAFGGPIVIAGIGGGMLALGLGALIVLAPGRTRQQVRVAHEPATATAERRPAQVFDPELHVSDESVEEIDDAPEQPTVWTPQPLPKPLYLSRGTVAASAMASMDAVEKLRAAAAASEQAQRAAASAPEVRPIRSATGPTGPTARAADATIAAAAPAPSAQAAPSRFSNMGVIDGVDAIDLDEALQRRRGA